MKREAGENPAQGRCCIRRETRANRATAAYTPREGRPGIVRSRKSEDLPIDRCQWCLGHGHAAGQAQSARAEPSCVPGPAPICPDWQEGQRVSHFDDRVRTSYRASLPHICPRLIPPRPVFLLVASRSQVASGPSPYAPDFTPLGDIAPCGGAFPVGRLESLLVPLAAMFATAFVMGIDALLPAVCACFASDLILSWWLRSRRIALPSVCSSLPCSRAMFADPGASSLVLWVPSLWRDSMAHGGLVVTAICGDRPVVMQSLAI
jgi:hypothetical protein